jgi:exodeoxyribonuclease V alpha subunit
MSAAKNYRRPYVSAMSESGLQLKTIAGVIERITYHNEESGYTIARLMPDRRSDRNDERDRLVTVIGNLIGVNVGEALELTGLWQHHEQHGWQFKVENYRSVLPATAQGIRKYLGSGLIKGIGPKTADKIVNHFDVATLDILEQSPERLREVPGIGKHKVGLIVAAWHEQKSIKEVMMFLQGNGVSTSLAVRIYKQYGDAAITIAKNEPYRLAREVWGIGFKTADKIAQSLGFKHDDPERLKAGALHTLSEASDDGHTYLPRPQLVEKAAELLSARAEQVEQAIDSLVIEHGAQIEVLRPQPDGALRFESIPLPSPSGRGVRGEGGQVSLAESKATYQVTGTSETPVTSILRDANAVIYLWPFFSAESNIARHLRRLVDCPPARDKLAEFKRVNFDVMFDYLAKTDNITLSERQKEGVIMALTQPVGVLTGGPGTGKTTSMRALIRALIAKKKTIVVAAPTGRAAKRLSETTGVEAKTLHRLLQLKPGGAAFYNQDYPVPADMVIVDETSMLDTLLMNTLLKAIAVGAHLLLVGDADQLPSVGAGNVLADIISGGIAPVVKLDHIFRQSSGSAIVTNAHRINHGEMPIFGPDIYDFYFFKQDEPEEASRLVVDLVSKRIPARFGIKPADIQVLSPMHGGKCGVAYLNEQLQATLNPPREDRPQKPFGSRIFRVGDKVMQIRNNYDKEVFNGDGGIVSAIDQENHTITVKLEDGRVVDYDFTDLDQLVLAYAVSIHKSQGSEYQACVIPLMMSHYLMLERKLIYTAVTRARKLVVLVGNKKALAMAVRNGPSTSTNTSRGGRYTGLAVRLAQDSD